ncbi:TetR/AcrR family transcriptional regulator C-terminal domain-containing protein [Streptomyces arenae]|uniref:TetR/AcrR family transcriptional regulator C-terminal domain-containing protein n=1 Tax=Streptomyces arenae TaxID=29301 RepID=UPI002657E427|nr:TetR/AcrR family transcriptional regulator C-terminal domain-containing protein [Streptomyces arenae]MCG7203692.1 TetR/AcrR family transcriptional regulator C-terminal domain-containing protein [Streptomyces arenae]
MGRPRTPLLDRAVIGRAALRLADQEGSLTIPGLARSLGVAPSALYHHVTGRDEIIALMREELLRETDMEEPYSGTWEQVLDQWARAYLNGFAAHPGAVPVLAVAPLSETFMHTVYDNVARSLSDAGFPLPQVMPLITALESFVLGSALDLVAPAVMLSKVDHDSAPYLSAALDGTAGGEQRATQAFETGLRAMLKGFAAVLDERP